MIRRILSILLALALLLSFAACDGTEEGKKPGKKPTSSQSDTSSDDTVSADDFESDDTNTTLTEEVITTESIIENTYWSKVEKTEEENVSSEDDYSSEELPEEEEKLQPDGVPVTLYVKDFGAKGDGKTDDAKAILSAVSALRESPKGSVLVFEKDKTYFYEDNGTSIRAVLYFNNNEGLTVKGDNTLILLGGTNLYYADITHTKEITLEGLNFDYKTKPAFFCETQSINKSEGTATVKIDRDIGLETGETYFLTNKQGFGVVPRDNSRYHMYIKKYEMLDRDAGLLKITFDTTNASTMRNLGESYCLTEGFVMPHPVTGNTIERGFSVYYNHDFTMRNINIYSTSRHVFSLQYGTGEFLFENVNVVRAPYDKELRYTSWADCYHLIHNRAKFTWKNCSNEWNYDDVFNISAETHTVSEVFSNKDFRIKPLNDVSGDIAQVGDTITVINTKTGALIGRAKVKAVISSNEDEYTTRVKVEEEMPLLQAGDHIMCWVDDTCAPGSEFINCNFDGTFRARTEITFTNCRFFNRRFWIGLETVNHEGTLGRNIIFRNCEFTGDNAWEITSGNSAKNGYCLKNIVFENCKNINLDKMMIGPYDEVIVK